LLQVENIDEIVRVKDGRGYEIVFKDKRKIWVTKPRAIVALLVLIKYGEGNETDLANNSKKIPALKKILHARYPASLIRDHYGDANKPFSELWNEEGFTFIGPVPKTEPGRSQRYALSPDDHDKLFLPAAKAHRKAPSSSAVSAIVQRVSGGCNLCGAKVMEKDATVPRTSFSRDRLKRRLDHRMPIQKHPEKGDDASNFQILCFYCNKSKWQICHACTTPVCDKCALDNMEGPRNARRGRAGGPSSTRSRIASPPDRNNPKGQPHSRSVGCTGGKAAKQS